MPRRRRTTTTRRPARTTTAPTGAIDRPPHLIATQVIADRLCVRFGSLEAVWQQVCDSPGGLVPYTNTPATSLARNRAEFSGDLLPVYREQATKSGGVFPGYIATIERLAETIKQAPDVQAVDVTRRRQWGKRGSSVNIHRVNRGQLSHAWRRTERTTRLGQSGVVTLALPWDVPWFVEAETIMHALAASLALGELLERSGKRVEVWSVGHGDAVWETPVDGAKHFTYAACLKTAQAPWNLRPLAATVSRGWFRRVAFRLMEQTGRANEYYSRTCADAKNWQQKTTTMWPLIGSGAPLATLAYGAYPVDEATTLAQAETWLRTQVARQNAA